MQQRFPGDIADKYMESLKQASGEILSTVTAQTNLSVESFTLCSYSLQFIFFSEQTFCGNYLTLGSHKKTAIVHALAYTSR